MRPSVTLQALRAQRRSLLVWTLALGGLIAVYLAVYPSVEGSGSAIQEFIDQMPKAYQALFTVGASLDYSSPAGYLNTELFTFMAPGLVLTYAIGAGAAGIAGEEDHRTLDLLLVNTVSRRRLLLEKAAAMAAGVTVLMVAMWGWLFVEGRIAGMAIPLAGSAAALAHLGLLGIEFGAIALLIGAATGRVGVSRAVPAALAVFAYLVNALAPLVGWLQPTRKLSPFFQYIGSDPLRTGVSPVAVAVSMMSIAVLLAVAMRRVPTP